MLDLTAGAGVTKERAQALTEVVTGEVGKSMDCAVLSRAEIEALMQFEVDRQLAGCDTDSCLSDVGDALGVQRLITGSVQRVDDHVVVALRIIDMNTLHVEKRVTDSARRDEALVPFVRWLAMRLTRGDEAAGDRPSVPAEIAVDDDNNPWRTAAWALLISGGTAAVLGLASGGAALGVQETLPSLKTARGADTVFIAQLEGAGPWLAGGANLGLYVGAGLAAIGAVLFFIPNDSGDAS